MGLSRSLGSVAEECFAFQILLKMCWLITDWHLSCGSCTPWPFVQDCYRTQWSWIRSEFSLFSLCILPVKFSTFSLKKKIYRKWNAWQCSRSEREKPLMELFKWPYCIIMNIRYFVFTFSILSCIMLSIPSTTTFAIFDSSSKKCKEECLHETLNVSHTIEVIIKYLSIVLLLPVIS